MFDLCFFFNWNDIPKESLKYLGMDFSKYLSSSYFIQTDTFKIRFSHSIDWAKQIRVELKKQIRQKKLNQRISNWCKLPVGSHSDCPCFSLDGGMIWMLSGEEKWLGQNSTSTPLRNFSKGLSYQTLPVSYTHLTLPTKRIV